MTEPVAIATARRVVEPPQQRPRDPALGLPVPDELLEALAVRVADHLAERIVPAPAPYLTVEEAAAYLGRPKSRVYELVAARRLRHYRDGRALLFRHADLDACLDTVEPEERAA